MGNSQTKETRVSPPGTATRASANPAPGARPEAQTPSSESTLRSSNNARPRRGSRPDLSFLGLSGNTEQDVTSLEARRESKLEREARKAEKEKTARLAERERSMKEEHVDGGYLVTQGVYVGIEDYNKAIVRQLMIERRLAPFWRGLNDFSENWAEHQLMAAARGLPIPPADEVPPELEYRVARKISPNSIAANDKPAHSLAIPTASRSQSFQSEASPHNSPAGTSYPFPSTSQGGTSTSPNANLFRTRAKTLASLTTSSRANSAGDMTPREYQLPADPFVNGQPIEVYLYKNSSECPICFLYYPAYLNTTRCCDQAICSECFVQIKRPDPHPPEHEHPDPSAPPASAADREAEEDGQLVSEVATCPYCKQPEFGITYVPPPFRRGLTYGGGSQQPFQIRSAMSSQTSISSGGMTPGGSGRRRGTSLSANAAEVITTDKIRPDWATKLATARAHAARRSAAATALHTAAYLMNGQSDNRAYGPFGRRNLLRRPTLEGLGPDANSHLNALAMLAERHAGRQQESAEYEARGNPFLPPPRGSSYRRSRMDDLEDMMMMEAIRLSLASEEERRKKEEKEAKKEAKRKDKEGKKADKAARKNSLVTTYANASNADSSSTAMERSESIQSSILEEDDSPSAGKGKAVDRPAHPEGITITNAEEGINGRTWPFGTSQESLVSSFPPATGEPIRRSHLRQMSNVSSTASSFVDHTGQSFPGSSTPPGGGAGMEPMFNFRSLAAMVENEDKADDSSHLEEAGSPDRPGSFEGLEDRSKAGGAPGSARAETVGPDGADHQLKALAASNGDIHKEVTNIMKGQVGHHQTTA